MLFSCVMVPQYREAMGELPVRVTFYGTRGSTPCSGENLQRYGGQTSCVVIEHAGTPVILDVGTGLRRYGCQLRDDGVTGFGATVLLTHTHWDHVQGLPFFAPLLDPTTQLDVYGPGDCGRPFPELIPDLMRPPYFPVTPEQLPATIRFHDLRDDDLGLDDVKIRARNVPHTDYTNGYRVELHGVSIAFVPDHQEPLDRPDHVDERVLELCDGVDLLIHDAQYTPEQLAQRPDWGHCTVDYALTVAKQCGAARLAMFHHDPWHDDDTIDTFAADAAASVADNPGVEVFAAAAGQSLGLGIA